MGRAGRMAGVAATVAALAFPPASCGPREAPVGGASPERLVLLVPAQVPSAVAMVAAEKKFFRRYGLDVEIRSAASGARAMADLVSGRADAVTTADVPIAVEAFSNRDFRVVATLGASSGDGCVVARRDRGILTPADLRGKHIVTQRASAAHFFLHCFLLKHGMNEGHVRVSFLKAEDLGGALERGEADALCFRQPQAGQTAARLGANGVSFQEPGLCFRTEEVVVSRLLLARRPGVVDSLLRGFVDGAGFARARPAEAIAIVARHLKVSAGELAALWSDLDVTVGLDQSLLLILEDEARWAVSRGLTGTREMPDYSALVDPGPLLRVKPETVTLIR